MTTIAMSRTQIAADRQATHSGGLKFKIKSKIFSFYNEAFYRTTFHVALAGNIDTFHDVLEFFRDHASYKKVPQLKGGEGVILTEDGKLWTFNNPALWLSIDQPTYAIGSGMNFAMGAMAAGASPYEAVKYACTLDPQSGMGITKINIE